MCQIHAKTLDSFFGVPSHITSDRGSQFTSSIWSLLCSFLGIVYAPTTSFASSVLIERFYRQLKVSLRARLASSDWFHHLPLVLLELCNVPTDNSPVSAAEVLFGTLLALPGVSQQPPGSFWRISQFLCPTIQSSTLIQEQKARFLQGYWPVLMYLLEKMQLNLP